MMRRTVQIVGGALVAALASGVVPLEAAAGTIRSYLLFEIDASASATAVPALRSQSMMNCKQLIAQIYPNEVVLHLHCNDRQDVSPAVMTLARIEGIKRTTVLTITAD